MYELKKNKSLKLEYTESIKINSNFTVNDPDTIQKLFKKEKYKHDQRPLNNN